MYGLRLATFALLAAGSSGALWGQSPQDVSSAQAAVRVSIPAKVRVSQVEDIDLGTWSGSGALEAEKQLCVWSSTEAYGITITTTEGDRGFAMSGPGRKALSYDVLWNAGTGYQALDSGQAYSGFSSSARSLQCDAGDDPANRPWLKISVAEKDLNGAQAGSYSDAITILIATE